MVGSFSGQMVAGWCILSLRFFYLLLTAQCSKSPLVVYFLIFATRVVAVMAIATSYNWWFLWDYTFYKWGDLLVLITEFYGHLPVINVDQTCEVPIFFGSSRWLVASFPPPRPPPRSGTFHRRWSRHLSTERHKGITVNPNPVGCWCLVIYCLIRGVQWIGLRDNLQETMVFTIKYRGFL